MRNINLSDNELYALFYDTYQIHANSIVFCPYRLAPLGAHIDHQLGNVLGFAIDVGTKIAYAVSFDAKCEFTSLQYNSNFITDVTVTCSVSDYMWTNYCQAAVAALGSKYVLDRGITALIDGPLPSMGLSSSASIVLATITAIAHANDIDLSPSELINLAHFAETNFIDTSCGKLDPSCEVLSSAGQLLHLDCLHDTYSYVSSPQANSSYRWMVCYSGVSANITTSNYALRRYECKQAAHALLQCANVHSALESSTLRAVPEYVFEVYKHQIPEVLCRRAEHFYSEMNRVACGVCAWRSGDVAQFGELMTESGSSSIINYECGCDEIITLYNILRSVEGVHGVRFSGAGFRGCCVCLIDPEKEQTILETTRSLYLDRFPRYSDLFFTKCYNSCKGIDGVRLIS